MGKNHEEILLFDFYMSVLFNFLLKMCILFKCIKTNHQSNHLNQCVVNSQPSPHSLEFGQYSSLHLQVFQLPVGGRKGIRSVDIYKQFPHFLQFFSRIVHENRLE